MASYVKKPPKENKFLEFLDMWVKPIVLLGGGTAVIIAFVAADNRDKKQHKAFTDTIIRHGDMVELEADCVKTWDTVDPPLKGRCLEYGQTRIYKKSLMNPKQKPEKSWFPHKPGVK